MRRRGKIIVLLMMCAAAALLFPPKDQLPFPQVLELSQPRTMNLPGWALEEEPTIRFEDHKFKYVLVFGCVGERGGFELGSEDVVLGLGQWEEILVYEYGAPDRWACSVECISKNCSIGSTEVWRQGFGSITWKVDDEGLYSSDDEGVSWTFVVGWQGNDLLSKEDILALREEVFL